MKKLLSNRLAVLCTLVVASLLPRVAHAQSTPDIPIEFDNESDGEYTNSQIYVNFLGTSGDNLTGTYEDSSGDTGNLSLYQSFSLANITPPGGVPTLDIENWSSGRIYISYGAPLSNLTSGYQPAAQGYQNPADPNFGIRYQYVEPTVDQPSGTTNTTEIYMDMTYIDFVGASLGLQANANVTEGTDLVQTSANGQTLYNAVAGGNLGNVLTSGGSGTPNSNYPPFPSPTLPLSNTTNFLRVIGPSQIGQNTNPNTTPAPYYHDWSNYILTDLQNTSINIAGNFVGTGNQTTANSTTIAQPYDYVATFSSTGNLTMTAQGGSGAGGVGSNVTISANFTSLNAETGIYGNNPWITIDLNGSLLAENPQNDVFGRIVGDLLAGLNFGDPGSTKVFNGTIDGQAVNQTVGSMTSTQWFDLVGNSSITGNSTAIANYVFGGLQPNPLDYNDYAADLFPLTTAYATAYEDRFGQNTVHFTVASNSTINEGGAVIVDIQPDQAVPEPAVAGMVMGLGALGVLAFRQRRRKSAGDSN